MKRRNFFGTIFGTWLASKLSGSKPSVFDHDIGIPQPLRYTATERLISRRLLTLHIPDSPMAFFDDKIDGNSPYDWIMIIYLHSNHQHDKILKVYRGGRECKFLHDNGGVLYVYPADRTKPPTVSERDNLYHDKNGMTHILKPA